LTWRIDLDSRGHTGNQANAIGNLIDLDADRHALSEADPGEYWVDVCDPLVIGVCIGDVNGPRDAAHFAANDLSIAHQFDLGGIAFADRGELRLLEIGANPEGIGIDNRDHALPDGRIVTYLRQQIRDPPVDRRTNPRALQIDPGLIALSFGLGDDRLGAHELRFEHLDLALSDREGRLRALQRRLILEKRRSRLLLHLYGSCLFLCELPVSRRLLLRKGQSRLRLLRLGLARHDLRLLRRDLRLDVLHIGLSLTHCRFSLFQGDPEVGRVDHKQQIALVYELI